VTSGGHEVDVGGAGPHSRFCQSLISSSSSWLGLSTSPLMETLDAVDYSSRPCWNLLVVRPNPQGPHVHLTSTWHHSHG